MNYTNSNKAQFDQSDANESDHDQSPFVQSETLFPLRPPNVFTGCFTGKFCIVDLNSPPILTTQPKKRGLVII